MTKIGHKVVVYNYEFSLVLCLIKNSLTALCSKSGRLQVGIITFRNGLAISNENRLCKFA